MNRREIDDPTAAMAWLHATIALLQCMPDGVKTKAAINRMQAIGMGILHNCCGPKGDFSS